MTDTGPKATAGVGLTLFIGGAHPTSARAAEALQAALEGHEWLRANLRVIDVFDEPRSALGAGVVATPSLLAVDGQRRLWMIGNLEDRAELANFLQGFLDGLGKKTAGAGDPGGVPDGDR